MLDIRALLYLVFDYLFELQHNDNKHLHCINLICEKKHKITKLKKRQSNSKI